MFGNFSRQFIGKDSAGVAFFSFPFVRFILLCRFLFLQTEMRLSFSYLQETQHN